jgi:signal transduction histidine kinase
MQRPEFVTLLGGKASDDDKFLLAGQPADRREYRRAFTVLGALFAASVIVAPFASVRLPTVAALIPVFGTGILMTDMITAALLFAQFSIVRWRALLVLASGYCFTALIVIPHALTFPAAFSPTSIIGGGLQTTPWLYVVWHAALPLAVIMYALLKDTRSESRLAQGSLGFAIAFSVAAVVASVAGITWVTVVHHEILPVMLLGSPVRLSLFGQAMFVTVIFLGAVAIVLLWNRRRSVLDLWLMVTVSVLVLEIVLNGVFSSVRFSIGFYAGRIYSFLTGAIVLVVLLSETTTLYPKLARSIRMRHHEREGLHLSMDVTAASIAHEVNQPLAAIVTNSEATIRWLSKSPPNLNEALEGLRTVIRDGNRASEIIAGIRAVFNRNTREKVSVNSNEIIRETIALFQSELQNGRVSVRTGLMEGLPRVVADKVQLQQVILNLIANAVDAMNSVSDRTRVLHVRSELDRSDGVLIMVEDSGPGIAPKDIDRIFEPFFTTKSSGMGMGLSICRSIIEAHGGRLTASTGQPHGSVFRIVLPAQDAGS